MAAHAWLTSQTREEVLVEAQIAGQLGMEGTDRDRPLTGRHRLTGRQAGEQFDPLADPLDARGPDEYTREGSTGQAGDFKWSLERLVLAAVGVAPDGEVHGAQQDLVGPPPEHLGGEQDQPGAGAEDGQSAGQLLPERLEQP